MLGINAEKLLAKVASLTTHQFWHSTACKLNYGGGAWVIRVQNLNTSGITFEVIAEVTECSSSDPHLVSKGLFNEGQMMFLSGRGFVLGTLSQEEGEKYLEPRTGASRKRVDIDLSKSGLKDSDRR